MLQETNKTRNKIWQNTESTNQHCTTILFHVNTNNDVDI